jgi:quercetin dioxygenase-like cupin family protein
MISWPPRRVVTGHDEQGKSIVLSDGPPEVIADVAAGEGRLAEIWAAGVTPVPLAAIEPEPNAYPVVVPPPRNGHVIRLLEMRPGWRSPMHRTESLDYGVVLQGEAHMVLDDSEVVLRPGDVVVQRGTDHAWENRSGSPVLILFVLVDAAFSDELRASIGDKADQLIVDLPAS